MDVYTAGKEIEALKTEVATLKKDAKDLNSALDSTIDQINRVLSNLKQRVSALEQAEKK